ncbi:MAG: ATP-binding protein [Cyanobacteria bacterium P01_G01_bin.19]
MSSTSIFIVEDEIITAKSIAKNIQKFGYQLAGIATSGSEAVPKILQTRPDLILIDIHLKNSDLDGITVADRIQSRLEIPIIYLTAHSDRKTLARAKITTPFGYILKPYGSKNLQISIELALHKHQQDLLTIKREKVLTTFLELPKDVAIAINEDNSAVYINPIKSSSSPTKDNYKAKNISIIDEQTQKISEPIQEVLEQGEVVYLENSAILLKKTGKATQVNPSKDLTAERDLKATESSSVLLLTRSRTNDNSSLNGDRLLKDLSGYLVDLIQDELRTPLTVILSTAQSLESYRQQWTIEKQNQNLRRIQQAIGQIRELLDNVAIWTEIEQDEISLNPDWVDLSTLCQDIIEELKLVDREGHQLTLSTQGKSKMVRLDKNILRRIIVNLLLNGLRYSPPGTPVNLALEFRADLVTIAISDRGMGIPSNEQKQIFEPFYRASNASLIKGAGLGLAIVKAYVRSCGGDISLSSQAQSETVFTVSLPL